MRCSGCGQPKHESWNPDSAGWYEVKEATCQGCAALEQRRELDDGYEPESKRWVLDTRPADKPLRPWDPLEQQVDDHHGDQHRRRRDRDHAASGQSVQGPSR